MDTVELNNGVRMPLLGLGVFQINDFAICKSCVKTALQAGYRLVDTAACYGNERAVGAALQEADVKREEVFLVSKVWIQDAGYERTMLSFKKSLSNLHTDYLDLYLIHMPYGDYHGSWRAMEELLHEGRVKAIGVCNFLPDRLLDLVSSHEVRPMVNQIELHPFCQQRELRGLMEQYKIQPMAWAPFAEGQRKIFQNPELAAIGEKYGKTPVQVILRWMVQSRIVTIPKSVHGERIRQNFAIEDFVLSPQDMAVIENLDTGRSLILDVHSLNEVRRLHGIRFEQ